MGYSAREHVILTKAREVRAPFLGVGVTTLQIEVEDTRPIEAHCDERFLNVTLADGRVLRAPLWWYPRLL
jgi:hypothetical protein